MSSSRASADLPLLVVALGGNALSPPSGDPSYAVERRIVADTAQELATVAEKGRRLLIVHGNGPQVGRLMRDDLSGEHLDIHVAQTQGELGYLLIQSLRRAGLEQCLALITRTEVDAQDPGLAAPAKAVGPVLADQPAGPGRRTGAGWRVLVGSPRPQRVTELDAIRRLLATHHVVAGGGGGVPVTADGVPVQGVVDKDWVAALLATALDAAGLVFVTDVAGAYRDFDSPDQRLLTRLDVTTAQALLDEGAFGPGSMAPKIESAVRYSSATGRPACITTGGAIQTALDGAAGTTVLGIAD